MSRLAERKAAGTGGGPAQPTKLLGEVAPSAMTMRSGVDGNIVYIFFIYQIKCSSLPVRPLQE